MSLSPSRPPTQKDVAQRAGVSQAAVSAVFRGNTEKIGVSKETRERILEAVRALDYRPNLSARAMRSRRTYNLGLLIGGTHHPWTPDGLMCALLHKAAAERGFHLTVIGILDGEEKLPPALRQSCLDVLLIDRHVPVTQAVLQSLENALTPALFLNEKRDENSIYLNEIESARKLAAHMMAAGYMHIDYLSLEAELDSRIMRDRLYGYSAALAEKWIHPRHMHPENAPVCSWIYDYLKSIDEPRAILCHNERDAAIVLSAATRLGMRVPEMVAVSCFGLGCFGLVSPWDVTGIRHPVEEMAGEVIKMADLISDPDRKNPHTPSRAYEGHFHQGDTTPG